MVIISLTVCHLEITRVTWSGQSRFSWTFSQQDEIFLQGAKHWHSITFWHVQSVQASHAHKRKKMTVRFSTQQLHSDKGLQMLSSCQKSVHNSTLFVNLIDLMTDFRGKLHVIVYPSPSNLVVNTVSSNWRLSPVSLTVFSLAPDFLSDCLFVPD